MRTALLWTTTASALALSVLLCSNLFASEVSSVGSGTDARWVAATRYEMHGLTEEAVAEYLRLLATDPENEAARDRVMVLVGREMPQWLPEEAEKAAPFKCQAVEMAFGQGEEKAEQRLLITQEGFGAREGERWDELHETGFKHIDYGYVWQPSRKRYEVRVAAHWEEPGQHPIAHNALGATLAFYCLAKELLGLDPTKPWGDPVDVWVTNKGQPGARAQGRAIYLYSAKTPRPAGEWLREIAHEYGHVSFPGLGGFTETDDEWVDGHLAELLFPKWLTASGAAWLSWPVAEWECEASTERQRLIGLVGSGELDKARLAGKDKAARDYLLGLALRFEQTEGPEALGKALKKCARGTAAGFGKAVRDLPRKDGA
ncbi:MAG: hypothetical protein MUQ26_03675 [Armatimonadetes bacterium]|nr:hypothetical protein [Armatimonadota bacterium]